MLAALIIVFREIFEAGLIIGIVMAATQGVAGHGRWISAGVLGGLLGAGIIALFVDTLSALFGGAGQELFNAAILATAVVMLAWHNVWMAQHGRKLVAEMQAAGEAVATGVRTLAALAIVVGVAVLREGAEVVLFLYGVAVSDGASGAAMFAGGMAGLVLGGLVSALTFFGLLAIPANYLFAITSFLIAFLAAGMAAQAIAFLDQANLITVLNQAVWDSSPILSQKSLVGRALHSLIGYTDQPTAMQIIVYLTTLAVIFILMKLVAPKAQASTAR